MRIMMIRRMSSRSDCRRRLGRALTQVRGLRT